MARHIDINDPQHIRTCSLCGARAARAAVKAFIRTLSESTKGMSETARRAAEDELERLRARVRDLEAQLGVSGHNDVTDRTDETEIVIHNWKARQKRERVESAGRPRGVNEAVRVFKANAGLKD